MSRLLNIQFQIIVGIALLGIAGMDAVMNGARNISELSWIGKVSVVIVMMFMVSQVVRVMIVLYKHLRKW